MNIGNLIDLSDLFGSLIGAFLGFAAAYWIFHLERSHEAEDEGRSRRALFQDIQALVQRAVVGLRRAGASYAGLAEAYGKEPYGMHPRPIHVNVQLRTLDRLDRQIVLAACREVAGVDEGGELWRGIVAFVDGANAQLEHQEGAVLALMKDMAGCAKEFDSQTRSLGLWVASVVNERQRVGSMNDSTTAELRAVLEDIRDIGNVEMPVMDRLLLQPLRELFRAQRLDLENTRSLAEVFHLARATYARYAAISAELAEQSNKYSGAVKAFAEMGDWLVDDMEACL